MQFREDLASTQRRPARHSLHRPTCPGTVTPACRKANAASSRRSSSTIFSSARRCTFSSCWSIRGSNRRPSTCVSSRCWARTASRSASSSPRATNSRPRNSKRASNATAPPSPSNGRSCHPCSARRARAARDAKKYSTISKNVYNYLKSRYPSGPFLPWIIYICTIKNKRHNGYS